LTEGTIKKLICYVRGAIKKLVANPDARDEKKIIDAIN
jgi:hypothetical protein